jgi:hypothetical protein
VFELAEQFADVLVINGALAVSFYGDDGGDVLEPAPGELRLWPRVAVGVLFPLETDVEGVRTLVRTAGFDVAQLDFLGVDDWSVHGTAIASELDFGGLSVVPRNASRDNETGVIRLGHRNRVHSLSPCRERTNRQHLRNRVAPRRTQPYGQAFGPPQHRSPRGTKPPQQRAATSAAPPERAQGHPHRRLRRTKQPTLR